MNQGASELYDATQEAYHAMLAERRGPDAGVKWRFSERRYNEAYAAWQASVAALRAGGGSRDAVRALLMARAQSIFFRQCPECGRIFDLSKPAEADEWYAGHDCEVGA